jgi:hypothetical protein
VCDLRDVAAASLDATIADADADGDDGDDADDGDGDGDDDDAAASEAVIAAAWLDAFTNTVFLCCSISSLACVGVKD